MIRIFAAKSYIFSNGEDEEKIKNHEIKDVPKWVAKTELFKLAEGDGSIQIIENSAQQKAAENNKTTTKKQTEKQAEKEASTEE